VTIGDARGVSKEFSRELKGIRDLYGNDTFEIFSIDPLGFDELTDLSKMQERHAAGRCRAQS
jgi:hypothetical protein